MKKNIEVEGHTPGAEATPEKHPIQARYERAVEVSTAFRQSFEHPEFGDVLMDELKVFCGSEADIFDKDASVMAYRCGRRSVLLMVQRILAMTNDDIEKIREKAIEKDPFTNAGDGYH